jgi:hypothetical protein
VILEYQRDRGPLPSTRDGLASWISALAERVPWVTLQVPYEAISPLRAAGLIVDDQGRLRFPADGDALDRVFSLLGLPVNATGGAKALLDAMAHNDQRTAPLHSLAVKVQPAKACALGWSGELFSLTVLLSNVGMRDESTLVSRGGPIVGVCAEYERPLVSLSPPKVASFPLEHARKIGVPTLKLPEGFLRTPIRVEPTRKEARSPRGREEKLARASKFIEALGEAWPRSIGSVFEVAWPVYRPAHGGPPLDAVHGSPLPDIQLS